MPAPCAMKPNSQNRFGLRALDSEGLSRFRVPGSQTPNPYPAIACAASQRVAELEALEAIAALSLTKKAAQKLQVGFLGFNKVSDGSFNRDST